MNVIDTSGLTKEQIFAEKRGWGATDSVIACGFGYRGSSRLKLWFQKREGTIDDDHDDDTRNLFRWGNWLEDDIAACFTEDTGLRFAAHQVLVRHPQYEWMTALIDGVTESGEIVDFKARTWHGARDLVDGDVSTLHPRDIIQANHQMSCCEVDHAHWACFDGSQLKLKRFIIPRDDELIETIVMCVQQFREQVLLGIMPDEFSPDDCEFLKRRFKRIELVQYVSGDATLIETARRYLEAKEEAKYAEARIKEHEAALRLAVGDAGRAQIGPFEVRRVARHRKGFEVQSSDYVEFRVIEPREDK